mmetsp:Transcript_6695/g.11249  ORF Transcript_6695/g.11249 Transcript_6695/m.11249 type:complete len:163 (+) Transcript_6695:481-969(+)
MMVQDTSVQFNNDVENLSGKNIPFKKAKNTSQLNKSGSSELLPDPATFDQFKVKFNLKVPNIIEVEDCDDGNEQPKPPRSKSKGLDLNSSSHLPLSKQNNDVSINNNSKQKEEKQKKSLRHPYEQLSHCSLEFNKSIYSSDSFSASNTSSDQEEVSSPRKVL